MWRCPTAHWCTLFFFFQYFYFRSFLFMYFWVHPILPCLIWHLAYPVDFFISDLVIFVSVWKFRLGVLKNISLISTKFFDCRKVRLSTFNVLFSNFIINVSSGIILIDQFFSLFSLLQAMVPWITSLLNMPQEWLILSVCLTGPESDTDLVKVLSTIFTVSGDSFLGLRWFTHIHMLLMCPSHKKIRTF